MRLASFHWPIGEIHKYIFRGDKVVRTLPGAERAALEVCTELASYRTCHTLPGPAYMPQSNPK